MPCSFVSVTGYLSFFSLRAAVPCRAVLCRCAEITLLMLEFTTSWTCSWFQSQFGNKLIYTGAGAADIVLSSRLNLPENIQVKRSLSPFREHAKSLN